MSEPAAYFPPPPPPVQVLPLPRHPAPKLATVTLLDADSAPLTTVPVAALAYTRALAPESVGADATTAAVQVCAHFERHGACNRGHRCRAAHCPERLETHHQSSSSAAHRCRLLAVSASPLSSTAPSVRSTPTMAAARDVDAPSHEVASTGKVRTSRGWRHAAYDATPCAA
jgi:hypothetical protein